MNRKHFNSTWNYSKALCILIFFAFLCGGLFADQSYGGTAKEIDASADAAMNRFYKIVKDAREVVQRSKGILILPNVKKGALIIGSKDRNLTEEKVKTASFPCLISPVNFNSKG